MSGSFQRLNHILWAIDILLSYDTVDLQNSMQYGATVYYLQIIGEASKKVGENVKALAPEIPWHKMAALRNYVVHDYPFVDYEALRKALHTLPQLRQDIVNLQQKLLHDQH